jgi:hypothetical protein
MDVFAAAGTELGSIGGIVGLLRVAGGICPPLAAIISIATLLSKPPKQQNL